MNAGFMREMRGMVFSLASMVLVLYHNNEVSAMKKVFVFAVVALFSSPLAARFDDRHRLMPAEGFVTEEPAAAASPVASSLESVDNPFLMPELRQWNEEEAPVVLRPLTPGRRWFTDEEAPVPDAVEVEVTPRFGRAHVVSFNMRDSAERALAEMAMRFPRAARLSTSVMRENVGGQYVWRGFFVGDREELAVLCRELTAIGEWCVVR